MKKNITIKKAAAVAVEKLEKANELKRMRANDLEELAAKHAEKAKEIEGEITIATVRLSTIEADEDGGRVSELRRTIRTLVNKSFTEMEAAGNYENEARNLLFETRESAVYVIRVDDDEKAEILTKSEYEKEINNLSTWAGTRFYRNYTSAGYVPTRVTFSGHGTPYNYFFGTLKQLKDAAEN